MWAVGFVRVHWEMYLPESAGCTRCELMIYRILAWDGLGVLGMLSKAKHGIEQLLSDSLKTMWLGNNAEGNGQKNWKVCVKYMTV